MFLYERDASRSPAAISLNEALPDYSREVRAARVQPRGLLCLGRAVASSSLDSVTPSQIKSQPAEERKHQDACSQKGSGA